MGLNEPFRVHQTTTTTGTGTYTLGAASAQFRNFRDYWSNGSTVAYCTADQCCNWEVGAGVLTYGAGDTISRVSILSSSNSGAAVSWPAGQKDIFAWRLNGTELTPEEFGAKGDDTTDDTAAIGLWFAAILATGLPGRMISTYKCNSQLVWDLTSVKETGIKITGNGMANCGLDLTGVSASPALLIYSSSGDCFFSTFRDFNITGNHAGVTLQIGSNGYVTAVNSFILEGIGVKNNSNASGACAVELNWFLDGSCYLIANAGGTSASDALRLRQVQFTDFRGSFANANNAVNFADGYCFGNDFSAVDCEVCNYAVAANTVNIGTNFFGGGTFVFNTAMLNLQQQNGYRILVFDGSNFGPNFLSLPVFASGSKAAAVLRGIDLSTTPSVPSSGTPVKNLTGNEIMVSIWFVGGGGTLTNVQVTNSDTAVNVAAFTNTTTPVVNVGCSFLLEPGDAATLTYSGSLVWLWRPIL